jgi:hypothetical protein
MKRDMNLVRDLLFLAEADGDDTELCETYGREVVAGHTAILVDAGLVDGAVARGSDGKPIASEIIRLTWAGHEFLDNARNDTIWRKAISIIKEKSISVSFDVLSSLLKSLVGSSLC